MSGKPRLILLGGFLGSGKTTLMLKLATILAERGNKVAVITNDQGDQLVDTAFLKAFGFAVGEVQNGCFCCNFSDFISNLRRILTEVAPDHILAEPTGSCTDLVSTVLNPLSLFHHKLVDLGSFFVLVDGPRLVEEYHLRNLDEPVLPREVLISHQIKEGSTLVLSKVDMITSDERQRATETLTHLNPSAEVVECSSTTGVGVQRLLAIAESHTQLNLPDPIAIDYEVYAAAEAEMGWYNGRAALAGKPIDPELLILNIASAISRKLGTDLIHGKLLLATDMGSVKVSVVSGGIQADSAIRNHALSETSNLLVNLRAEMDPYSLASIALEAINEIALDKGVTVTDYEYTSVYPDAPVPEYRIENSDRIENED